MLIYFFLSIPFFLLALVIHEYSHGWVAYKLGDPTAKHSGRLTFNPIAHIDLVGTIMLPAFLLLMHSPVLFGWAKPVPVNFSYLKNPKEDMFWVGLAGPFANMLAAVVLAVFLKVPFLAGIPIFKILFSQMIVMNIVLAVFNMFPLPPLDGSRILFSILPNDIAYLYIKLERYGMFILLGLLWLGVTDRIIWPIVNFLVKLMGV